MRKPLGVALGVCLFLLAHGTSPGEPIKPSDRATKTTSGLKYEEIFAGKGEEAKSGKTVTIHYIAWLAMDGRKIDSSRDRDKPYTFVLGDREVIAGLEEGVLGMKLNGKRKLHIPAKLGYGENGAGRDVPANADLVFEVELLKVE